MSDLKQLSILLVEDEEQLRRETAFFLELYCGRVLQAANGRDALQLFEQERADLVLSDIRMPVMDGLELAARLKDLAPDTPLIFCTAFTDTVYLLRAIDLGVAAFVHKPVDADELLAVIRKAALPVLQRREITGLSAELAASVSSHFGPSPALHGLGDMAIRIARTPFNVLLLGETGTGKSRLASIIHSLSPRHEAPFVPVQLGAMPVQLAESELFGHLRGAFTGADRNKTGLVETARGGTLFLDDIESCPPSLQAKLLRFVDEKRFTSVGSTTEKSADVRIIAASNKNLKELTLTGEFREDLYYRLADVTIPLPPLRETPEAIVPLSLKFLHETCDELGRDLPRLTDEARELLGTMAWPGNVRQLKSVIRRVALLSGTDVTPADVSLSANEGAAPALLGGPACCTAPPPLPCSMDALETWALEQALHFCGGKRMKTAAMLGMNYYTFRRRLEKHGIRLDEE